MADSSTCCGSCVPYVKEACNTPIALSHYETPNGTFPPRDKICSSLCETKYAFQVGLRPSATARWLPPAWTCGGLHKHVSCLLGPELVDDLKSRRKTTKYVLQHFLSLKGGKHGTVESGHLGFTRVHRRRRGYVGTSRVITGA